jgi:hypothetical protein
VVFPHDRAAVSGHPSGRHLTPVVFPLANLEYVAYVAHDFRKIIEESDTLHPVVVLGP